MDIYTCNFPIQGVPNKPNSYLYQSRFNSLSSIFDQIVSKMCSPSKCQLLIFVSDFLLDFSVEAEQVLSEICEIINFVESKGHLITFAYLLYVPGYSKDPKAVKDLFVPQPDRTLFVSKVNDKLQKIAKHNPIKTSFYNKYVGYNSRKDSYMPSDWENHSSTAETHSSYSLCFKFTPAALKLRSHEFYKHVDQFVNAVK